MPTFFASSVSGGSYHSYSTSRDITWGHWPWRTVSLPVLVAHGRRVSFMLLFNLHISRMGFREPIYGTWGLSVSLMSFMVPRGWSNRLSPFLERHQQVDILGVLLKYLHDVWTDCNQIWSRHSYCPEDDPLTFPVATPVSQSFNLPVKYLTSLPDAQPQYFVQTPGWSCSTTSKLIFVVFDINDNHQVKNVIIQRWQRPTIQLMTKYLMCL